MSSLTTLSGKPSGYEAVEPGLVGFLFGNNSYLFNMVLPSPITHPQGGTASVVPVRLDSYFRCPTFDNMDVVVTGEFDADFVFRTNIILIKDTGLVLRGVRRINFLVAVLLGIAAVAVPLLLGGAILLFYGGLVQGGAPIVVKILVLVIYILVLIITASPALIFIRLTAIPSLFETMERWIGRMVCYPPK